MRTNEILGEVLALLHLSAHALLLAHVLGSGSAWPGYALLVLADLLAGLRSR